jgi:hypothetical protein
MHDSGPAARMTAARPGSMLDLFGPALEARDTFTRPPACVVLLKTQAEWVNIGCAVTTTRKI